MIVTTPDLYLQLSVSIFSSWIQWVAVRTLGIIIDRSSVEPNPPLLLIVRRLAHSTSLPAP